MFFDPTERNVNPFLFQTGIRAMKKLVLTLAIHDKDVTMAKAAQVGFNVRTGLALPLEECSGAETHRNDELGLPNTPQTAAHHRSANQPASAIRGKGSGSRQLAPHRLHTAVAPGVR